MNKRFKTIARLQYAAEAQIIKGRLEAEGIQVYLFDNLTIDIDPLVSHAVGGVKLKVLAQQALEAQCILDSIKKYAIDDEGNTLNCPNCGDSRISMYSKINNLKSLVAFIIGFIFATLPFHTCYIYQCENCKTEFDLK